MGSVIDSDLLLRGAFYVTLAACAGTLFLICAIAWLRIARAAQARWNERLRRMWESQIATCALEPPVQLPLVHPLHRPAFFALWNHYYDLLSGDALRNLQQLAASPQLRDYVNHALRHGSLRERIVAATTAGHLGDPAASTALQKLVNHHSPTLSLAAAKSLVEIDAAANLPSLLPLIAQRVDWPIASVATTLRGLGAEIIGGPLAHAVLHCAQQPHEPQELARLLRLTEIARQDHIMPAIRVLFERGEVLNAEVLAACLRLILAPDDAHWARKYLAHSEWYVRVCAANALRRAGGNQDRAALTRLLTDAHWWVRYRAAQALAALPGVSAADIAQLRDSVSDGYARDMLNCVLAENALR